MTRQLGAAVFSLALMSAVQPAFADVCVIDYETFELRGVTGDDHIEIAEEQAAEYQDWYRNGEVIEMRGLRYEKYGLPRVLMPDEVKFWGFINSTPFMVEATDASEEPDLIYGLAQPVDCAFQPYARVE